MGMRDWARQFLDHGSKVPIAWLEYTNIYVLEKLFNSSNTLFSLVTSYWQYWQNLTVVIGFDFFATLGPRGP